MTPELRHCFSITIQVDKPIIVSRSPQTGKEVKIAAANVPAFVSGKALKDAVK